MGVIIRPMLQKKLVVLDMVGLNKKEELGVAERQKFITTEDDESVVGAAVSASSSSSSSATREIPPSSTSSVREEGDGGDDFDGFDDLLATDLLGLDEEEVVEPPIPPTPEPSRTRKRPWED